jgi:hypothetical protein
MRRLSGVRGRFAAAAAVHRRLSIVATVLVFARLAGVLARRENCDKTPIAARPRRRNGDGKTTADFFANRLLTIPPKPIL